MKLKSRLHTLATAALLICPAYTLLAQEEFPEDVQDVPAAPIDNLIVMALVLAVCFAFYFIKKTNQTKAKIN
ncbi:hypothetical protein KBJ98_09740 [Flavobacterium sp. F-328]|jgi:hypothetical protein|uniref:Signal peptidase n=1 Tax=Flavobacterium erciyesense TaxID=2825842 RepID=A0ABS5D4M8_9FLAO|nr:hypothetical protein [Flavobacterium erciyesense]MBQ0908982.1 hypothetical protein [Flavobacterium erciyesense]